MAAYRVVTVKVPEAQAARIESVTFQTLEDVVTDVIMNWFSDSRRRDMPVKRQGISWSVPLYAAMEKHVGIGKMSAYIREAVYNELKITDKDLVKLPDWKEGRQAQKTAYTKRSKAKDRESIQAPVFFPAQWIERIESKFPNKVATWIKACVQTRLEKDFRVSIPLQKGMGEFMNR